MNKLRSILTGFSVAWGIFMLIILLGVGGGTEKGVKEEFSQDAVNSIRIRGGMTRLPYKGNRSGRRIELNNDDYRHIKSKLKGVEYISAFYQMWEENAISYQNKFGAFSVIGCHPDNAHIEHSNLVDGRMINDFDIEKERKVAVIGSQVKKHLFGKSSPINRYININHILFKVVGVFENEMDDRVNRLVYTPISTAQHLFNAKKKVQAIKFTTGDATLEENQQMERGARKILSEGHRFAENDEKAVQISTDFDIYIKYMNLFKNIRIFIWAIGIGTIMAGIVGISNIMLISVKERTKEIGIRKAIGAPPGVIVFQIMAEAIFITSLFGYLGLIAGVGGLELVGHFIPKTAYFREPDVHLQVAFLAMILLIAAGALAGYIPAKRAASINPIEALRGE